MRLTNRQPNMDLERYRKRREDWLVKKASRSAIEKLERQALERAERAKAMKIVEEQLETCWNEETPLAKMFHVERR